MKKYKINEIFYSLQGEGRWSGRAAIFIRFSICNLSCPFCDTNFKRYESYTASEILGAIKAYPTDFVVMTGGEPTLQADSDLIMYLKNNGYYIAIETNGTHEVPLGVDWITVSPKDMFVKNADVKVEYCDELKVVFDGVHTDFERYDSIPSLQKFLQPCDTLNEAQNSVILRFAIEYIKQHPSWQLSLQTQKIIRVR